MSRQQLKQFARPNKNMLEAIQNYTFNKIMFEMNKGTGSTYKYPQVNSYKHCSLSHLDELEPIRLKDMKVNKHHVGRSLLCRVIAKPYIGLSLRVLVDDEDGGQAEILELFNYMHDYRIDPVELFPEYTVLVIKEPYLTTVMWEESDTCIQVESPTDVVILDKHEIKKWKNPEEPELAYEQLNDLGNKFFVAKQYRNAIRHYTRALKVVNCVPNE